MRITGTNITSDILILWEIMICLLFLYFTIQSYIEKEYRAARWFSLLLIILPLPGFLLALVQFPHQEIIKNVFITVQLFLGLLFFLPFKGGKKITFDLPKSRIDERDIMFSRRLLQKGSPRYREYYERKPENLEADNIFRERPGLLNKGSVNYDAVMFASSEASFFTVEQFTGAVNGTPSHIKQSLDTTGIVTYIKNWTKKLGALDVGITNLRDYHIYSHAGRGEHYGEEIKLNHKFAIAFTVEMNFEFTAAGPQAPIVMESGQQYLNAGAIAVQLASFIRELGYEARAHIDANYQVVCPLVAKDAGLGEIGRMGLLITPRYGPRVRIGVVTTNLPLFTDTITNDTNVIDFCDRCMKCANTCPGQAIPSGKRTNIDGSKKWQINQEKCFQFWCTVGTDCGRCIAVCPYSHPDNPMHRFIRFGIRNNFLYRRAAIFLDNWIYGEKPKPKPIPKWMKVKNV